MLSPFFLPWQQQGVEFLLQEAPVPAALSLCHTRVPAVPNPSTVANASQRTGQQAIQRARPQAGQQSAQQGTPHTMSRPTSNNLPHHGAARPYAPQTPSQNPAQNPWQQTAARPAMPTHTGEQAGVQAQNRQPAYASAHQVHTPAPRVAQGTAPATHSSQTFAPASGPTSGPASASPFPVEHWPQAWQERLRLTKPARVIWTYWNLGHDVSGEASDARRALLRKILGDLKHPAGTHSFWPVALPTQAKHAHASTALEANIPAFWAGAEHLGARVIIILGDAATQALNFQVQDVPFKQMKHQGRPIILAKDMDELIENPHIYDRMMTYLRPFLTQYLHLM